MIIDGSPEVSALFRSAARAPIVPVADRRSGFRLGPREVEALLPHRHAFRLVDGITHVDRDAATIVCVQDLGRAATWAEGHFPGRPLWPGVLQVEAVGQAGLCLIRLMDGARGDVAGRDFVLTHIIGARFLRPVTPAGELEIVACVVPDGLFHAVIGQCLQHGAICSLAAVRGIDKEKET